MSSHEIHLYKDVVREKDDERIFSYWPLDSYKSGLFLRLARKSRVRPEKMLRSYAARFPSDAFGAIAHAGDIFIGEIVSFVIHRTKSKSIEPIACTRERDAINDRQKIMHEYFNRSLFQKTECLKRSLYQQCCKYHKYTSDIINVSNV